MEAPRQAPATTAQRPRPRRRPDPPHDAGVVLRMLAQGIPLTLLPDLAWPTGIGPDDDATTPGADPPTRTDFSGGPLAC